MKILVLTSRFPYPIEKGDKLRIYHQMRELSKRHEIILFSLTEFPIEAEHRQKVAQLCTYMEIVRLPTWQKPIRILLGLLAGKPIQTAYFFTSTALKKLRQLVRRTQPDLLYCQLLRMAPYARPLDLPKAIDYMDCFSIGMKRQAEKSPFPTSLLYKRESKKLTRYEREIFSAFSFHTIISVQDRNQLSLPEREQIHIVPNGVDLDFFQPRPNARKKYEVVFVGNMGYFPNVQAARYLCQEVMPIVWKSSPVCHVLLAGVRPSVEVRRLARDPRITVSGWMEDIRDAYASGRLFVAPLFTGSGQQNKILEAMAMGIPCLTTSLVNKAIGAEEGKEIWVAENPAEFAAQILAGLKGAFLRERLGENGLAFVQENVGWKGAVRLLETGLEGLIEESS